MTQNRCVFRAMHSHIPLPTSTCASLTEHRGLTAALHRLLVSAQEEPLAAEGEAATEAPPVESSDVPVPAPEIEPASAETEGAEDPAGEEEGGAE